MRSCPIFLLAAGILVLASTPARAEGLLGSILPPEPYEAAGLDPDPGADLDVSARATSTDSATLALGAASTADTAARRVSADRSGSRTLLVLRGLERMGEFMPIAQGPASLLRRYYDATHTDRYALDLGANPVRDDYRMAVKVRF